MSANTLFTKYLSARAQEDVAGLVRLAPDGRPSTPAELVEKVLKQFEGTFMTFRYVHEPLREHGEVVFHERDLLNVVLAVHESIIRIRSDLRNWAGVLYDPGDEGRSAGEVLDRLTAAYRAALLG